MSPVATNSSRLPIAIVGAGLMGTGLARLFHRIGWAVTAWDADAGALGRLCREVTGVRRAEDLPDAVAGAGLVIEAVAETVKVKQSVFADLARSTGPGTWLATNSSVIPVGVVGAELSDGDAARVLGTHFWNPPDLVPLVEVIAGPRTSSDAVTQVMQLLAAAGREPVQVRCDVVPGNRLQHALWREAMALVDEGVCSAEDVDRIVKRSFGARLAVLGPLENADLVGLGLTRQIHQVVLPTLSRSITPAAGLQRLIEAGRTGVASGGGYYKEWTPQDVAALRQRLTTHLHQCFGSSP